MTDLDELFAGISGYEWDPKKAEKNFKKHQIDFDDATEVF